ncbi:hypothetical protein KBD59_05855 [Candidatus Gracilibacteria bacterium]|nr:hypothetical protein [Candidatus Gracilibacteria bacterium]
MHDIKIPDGQVKKSGFEAKPLTPSELRQSEPTDKIKVKFEKFVQLVASHDFTEIMKNYANEDIILSTNLLTDLANSHEETEEKPNRVPAYVLGGVLIGVVIAYIVMRFF